MNVHFLSRKLDWRTPQKLYQELNEEYNFDFDPCPPHPDFDGLEVEWGKCNFVNPPYGRQIGKWLKKGYEENQKGKTVVFLIPSRTDTKWWHNYVMRADSIQFIKGRLKFEGAKYNAPFPSAIVVFLGGR
jgi:site-specific DNA-methyltransferase (adenine-specific)